MDAMAGTDREDEDVLRGLVRKDEHAFRTLIDVTEMPLRSYIATFAVDLEMIEEVIQQTYVICFEQIAAYRGEGSLLAWLKGIARNTLRTELRRRRRARTSAVGDLDQWFCQHRLERLDRDGPDDDRLAQQLARLRKCLAGVPERLRGILDLRYRHELSIGDIAARQSTSRDAMAKVLQRAVARLRRCMEREARAT